MSATLLRGRNGLWTVAKFLVGKGECGGIHVLAGGKKGRAPLRRRDPENRRLMPSCY
jgi:hypothetical protein